MEAGRGGGNDPGPKLATVSCSVPYAPGRGPRAVFIDGRSCACPSVRLPIPLVAAVGANLGLKCRRFVDRPKRYEDVREPMERRQGRRNDRRPDMAALSVAMPRAPNLHRFVVGRFRFRAGLYSSVRSCPPVRLPVPWWQQSAPASAPASNVGAPSALQAGQYTTELAARARCPSDTVVWVNTPTRIYHYSGTRYYGHTLKGGYMCEADARSAGYRAARNRQREAEAHSGLALLTRLSLGSSLLV